MQNKRNVLVTGGSRGIGLAVANEYRSHLDRYSVFAPARNELDLASKESTLSFIERHQDHGFDIIVNNAGCNDINHIENVNLDDLYNMTNVNMIAPLLLLRGFVPKMKERAFGRIVNIGSIWGIASKPGRVVYSMTKHGVHGITSTLATELAPYNILTNTLCPGFTMTDLTRKNNSDEEIRQMETMIPLGRLATPDEIARVVFFLANENNTYLTGQQIIVDGGFTAQ